MQDTEYEKRYTLVYNGKCLGTWDTLEEISHKYECVGYIRDNETREVYKMKKFATDATYEHADIGTQVHMVVYGLPVKCHVHDGKICDPLISMWGITEKDGRGRAKELGITDKKIILRYGIGCYHYIHCPICKKTVDYDIYSTGECDYHGLVKAWNEVKE